MSKKHYKQAAEFIAKSGQTSDTKRQMAQLIITINDNLNFDKQRFLNACGL